MYVAAYCDWGVDLDDVAFFDQQFARFVAEVSDSGFGDDLAGAEVGDVAVRSALANACRQGKGWVKYRSRSLIMSYFRHAGGVLQYTQE